MGCNNSKGTTEGSAPAANSGQQEQPAATQASGEKLSSVTPATSSFFLKKRFLKFLFFFHDNLTGKRDIESSVFQITKILEEFNDLGASFFFYQSVMYIASYLDLVKGPRL